jgi:MFS family permease
MQLLSRVRDTFRKLPADGAILFATRFTRLFAYGFLSVVLVLYLREVGLSEWQVGTLFMLSLLGDTAISLWLTTTADSTGRRKILVAGSLLMALAGIVFAFSSNYWLLIAAATIGVISPSGNEIGPFLSVEQASLSQLASDDRRTDVFAWYNLAGSLATASGSLCGGLAAQFLESIGRTGASSHRPLVIAYGLVGVLLALAFATLSSRVEVAQRQPARVSNLRTRFGLHKSRRVVFQLSALFAMDAFGGGFVMQSIVAYWLHLRFRIEPAAIGSVFFAANLLAGVSALSAAWVARRIGLLNTMVVTHLPSNVLLILVPLMPEAWMAIVVLLLRFSISQMDVPTRQSYTMAVVSPDERSAAAGISGVARSIGAALSPALATAFLASAPLWSFPFFLGGGIKILYDLILYRAFAASERGNRAGGL